VIAVLVLSVFAVLICANCGARRCCKMHVALLRRQRQHEDRQNHPDRPPSPGGDHPGAVLWMFSVSIKPNNEPFAIPVRMWPHPTFENYENAFYPEFRRYFCEQHYRPLRP
jgi:hypothetical protein